MSRFNGYLIQSLHYFYKVISRERLKEQRWWDAKHTFPFCSCLNILGMIEKAKSFFLEFNQTGIILIVNKLLNYIRVEICGNNVNVFYFPNYKLGFYFLPPCFSMPCFFLFIPHFKLNRRNIQSFFVKVNFTFYRSLRIK